MKSQDQVGLRNLIIFILVIFIGLVSIVAINRVFRSIYDRLDQSYQNKQMEVTIGRYILSHLQTIEGQFYKIGLSKDYENGLLIMDEMEIEISHLKESFDTLQNGGTISHHIELNLVDTPQYLEDLEYVATQNINYNLEAIDITPKLDLTLEYSHDLIQMIGNYQEAEVNMDQMMLDDIDQEINRFMKLIPPHFIRMKENASRLIYESKIEADAYQKDILSQKEMFDFIELVVSISVIVTIILLGYIFGKQIIDINQTLSQYAVEAEKANVAKTLFISNMSHEIRTPLNAIIGFSEVLNGSNKLPDKEKEYSEIITRSASSLLDIVNDILDYSKIETDNVKLEQISFKSEDLLEEIIELYSLKADEKEIQLIYSPNVLMPRFLFGDPIRLRQVLINLLTNAIKFTDHGGQVELKVNISNMTQEYVDLEYAVIDNGIGIAPENQKKVFKSFEQAEKGTMRKFGGTGLGLAISQKLVKSMGGQLHLRSELHKGSEFSFTIRHTIDAESIKEEKSLNWSMKFGVCCKKTQCAVLRESIIYYLADFGTVINDFDTKHYSDMDMIFVFYNYDIIKRLEFISENYQDVPIIYVGDVSLLNTKERQYMNDIMTAPIYKSKVLKMLARYYKGGLVAQDGKAINYQGRVLIAEDNLINQRLMDVLLTKYGIKADFVENGEDAVKSFREKPYDLVFMDLRMPVMGGIEATRIIRDLEKTLNCHTTIIALTADALRNSGDDKDLDRFDEYMTKPIQVDKLEEYLGKYLVPILDVEFENLVEQGLDLNREIGFDSHKKVEGMYLDAGYDVEERAEEIGFTKDEFMPLLDDFFLMSHEYIHSIRQGLDERNSEELKKALHQLKGTSANLRLKGLAGKMLEYEGYAVNHEFEKIDLNGIEESLEKLHDHIQNQK